MAGGSDERRYDIRADAAEDLGSVDDDGEQLDHWRNLRMLAGGTPASL
jgi:hypothetical protein